MTGREAAEQQERDEATATRRRAIEAQAARDEGKRWQASMMADLRLRQSQRDSQQSPPNDPSICSSSNTSSTSSDSDSETGEPRRSGRCYDLTSWLGETEVSGGQSRGYSVR